MPDKTSGNCWAGVADVLTWITLDNPGKVELHQYMGDGTPDSKIITWIGAN